MPELPEVEAVRRALAPHLDGRTITDGRILRPDVIAHPAPEDFVARLRGQCFAAPDRRGKFLLFPFASQDAMVIHLRMTGQLQLVSPQTPVPSHTHVILSLDDGREFRFRDTRRLGHLWILEDGEPDTYTGMEHLGPEPDDVTADDLKRMFAGRKRPIKSTLMDQHLLAGLGNIYADEILFRAGISPLRPAGELRRTELEKLVEVMPGTLAAAVDRGVSCSTFLFGEPIERRQPEGWRVYGRKGQPCSACGEPLVGIRIGGRSSVYCPHCQS